MTPAAGMIADQFGVLADAGDGNGAFARDGAVFIEDTAFLLAQRILGQEEIFLPQTVEAIAKPRAVGARHPVEQIIG